MAVDVRAELRRLILDGLCGRTRKQLFREARALFAKHGEDLSLTAFESWYQGLKFPANRKRQLLLGDVVGGPCGRAIKVLPAPAFRGFRRRVMKETETIMAHGSKHGTDGKRGREFPSMSVRGEDGLWHKHPVIMCCKCETRVHHTGRRGAMEDEQIFSKMGWEVEEGHDVCPACVAKRKVVKMSDHKKPEAAEVVKQQEVLGQMTREDGRLLIKAIEVHWDDNAKAYQPGWSDLKIAETEGVAIEWVRSIRGQHYGDVGEDPGVAAFIAEQIVLKDELGDLNKHLSELESTMTASSKLIEGYKEKQTSLSTKVHRLAQIAERLRPPFRDAG